MFGKHEHNPENSAFSILFVLSIASSDNSFGNKNNNISVRFHFVNKYLFLNRLKLGNDCVGSA